MLDKLITDLRERVAALEGVVFGPGIVRGQSATDRRLFKNDYAVREGVSTRTLERGVKDGRYAQPDDFINGKPCWWLSTVQRHDRNRVPGTMRRVGERATSSTPARIHPGVDENQTEEG
jgi:hypothetical protein